MGASVSVQTIEVSFVNKDTGLLLSNQEIIKKIEYDYSETFYKKYKEESSYIKYKKWLKENS